MNTLWMCLFRGGGKKAGENLQRCVTEATVTMAKNMRSFGPTEHSCTFLRSRGDFQCLKGSRRSDPLANKVESSLPLHSCVPTVFRDIPAHSSNQNVHSKPPSHDACTAESLVNKAHSCILVSSRPFCVSWAASVNQLAAATAGFDAPLFFSPKVLLNFCRCLGVRRQLGVGYTH